MVDARMLETDMFFPSVMDALSGSDPVRFSSELMLFSKKISHVPENANEKKRNGIFHGKKQLFTEGCRSIAKKTSTFF